MHTSINIDQTCVINKETDSEFTFVESVKLVISLCKNSCVNDLPHFSETEVLIIDLACKLNFRSNVFLACDVFTSWPSDFPLPSEKKNRGSCGIRKKSFSKCFQCNQFNWEVTI